MKRVILAAVLYLISAAAGIGATLGNPLTNRSTNDTGLGVTYVWLQSFPGAAFGQKILKWSFFDDDNSTPNRQITPLLFEQTGPKQFVLRGVGQTRTSSESGAQTFEFSLQAGSAKIENASYLFGWKDGSPSTHNEGVIDWDEGGSVSIIGGENEVSLPGIGATLDLSTKEYRSRTYSFQVETGNPGEPVTQGLLAYLPFDGTWADASGNGHNATPNISGFGVDRLNVPGRSVLFGRDLADSTVLQNTQGIVLNEYTLSMWFKTPRTDGQDRFLISKGGEQMEIHLRGGAGVRFVQSPGVYIDAPGVIVPNRWIHIVCRAGSFADGGRVFIDGIDVGATPSAGNPSLPFTISGSVPMRIGQRFTQEQVHQFEGQIDDIRIYNRALARNEILQLFAFESFCSPHPAKATATIAGGAVTAAIITDFGCGYIAVPSVRILGGGGTGAMATAIMEAGLVTTLTITNAGSGYTSPPRILIESPPFVPATTIAISRIKVTQHVRINHTYILESSSDLTNWTPTGPQYTAESEEITNEFSVNPGDQFFRVREVP